MMSENTSKYILQVKDLHTTFSTDKGGVVKAVNGVSFNLEPGKILGIVGESGSGKSVTAYSIMDILSDNGGVTGGEILYKGEDITKWDEKKMQTFRGKCCSIIFQDPMTSLNPVFTIGNQLEEAILLHTKKNRAQAKARAIEMLSLVGVNEPAKRVKQYPYELSGGMRQRVMIAMALACEPDILIADEPTTALDVTIQAQILKLMNELKQQTGSSILFITHDLGVIHEMADEVAVMYCGQIVEKADAYTIFHKGVHSHPYTEGLMTSIPRLNTPKGKRLEAIPGAVPNPLYLPQGCKFAPRCKYCTEKCKQAEPELAEVAPNHLVRCFYPETAGRTEHGE